MSGREATVDCDRSAVCLARQHEPSCRSQMSAADLEASGREATDHDRPHWCDHDGLDALVPPPARLFYVGQSDRNGLVTRGCPLSSTPGEPSPPAGEQS